MNSGIHRLAVLAAAVAFCVIVLGAYVRLSHAGLGCPDWPGCYGQLTWPSAAQEIQEANRVFPDRPVETGKAWKEMVHRYLAGALVLLVVAINFIAWKSPDSRQKYGVIAGVLLALILFQAALGMWTVTLKLWPIVVMGHLLGGMATFALMLWLAYRTGNPDHHAAGPPWREARTWITTGLAVLIMQIALGGWTSANYSALACPDFPTCQGELWPESNFQEGFMLWREIGVDYEGGILDLPSRVAIQMAHRIGALITFVLLGMLAIKLARTPTSQRIALVLGLLLIAQVILGVLNIILYLPLSTAVAHNGIAGLLLAAMIWLFYKSGISSLEQHSVLGE
jgi:cytochrome c oxidase assembly protein subunit 15